MTETPANFPILLAGVSAQSRFGRSTPVKLAEGLAALQRHEAEGLITKTEHDWLKACFNNSLEHAFSALFSDTYVNAGEYEKLPRDVYDLYSEVSWPACHILAGKLAKVEKYQAKVAKGSMPDHEMVGKLREFYAEVVPLGARVTALKDKIGKRAPKETKTSIALAERQEKAMTCQCCGRDILAETGVIAHHGYERPGQGWQTASCPGARELPFEASRDALGEYIQNLKNAVETNRATLANVQAEKNPISWKFQDVTSRINAWTPLKEKMVFVTRETFDAVAAETEPLRRKDIRPTTYDDLKARLVSDIQTTIRHLEDAITFQTGRYNGWKGVTHTFTDGQWVAIAA